MALTPKQSQERTKPDAQTIKRLEETIDAEILDAFTRGQRSVTIDTSLFPNTPTREHIAAKYRIAGWDVRHRSDQRDGDYLEFTEPKHQDQRDALSYYR